MDVDGIKRIKDAPGHSAGDRLLMQLAVSLRRSIRAVDTPARIGGDEFCVLAPNQDGKHAFLLAQRLARAVEAEVASPDDAPARLSIGVVCCPEHGDTAEALLEVADKAMYRAKAAGEGVAMGENGVPVVAEGAKRE